MPIQVLSKLHQAQSSIYSSIRLIERNCLESISVILGFFHSLIDIFV